MIEIKEIRTSDKDYCFVESLLESAFPLDERRDRKEQRGYTDFKENFKTNVILRGFNKQVQIYEDKFMKHCFGVIK